MNTGKKDRKRKQPDYVKKLNLVLPTESDSERSVAAPENPPQAINTKANEPEVAAKSILSIDLY